MLDFQPIRDQRLSDRVAQRLTKALRGGELPVGTRLPPEGQLAEQFGVSRGILREALTILESRGYISRTPKGGTIVQSTVGDDLARSLSGQLRQATYRDLLEFREAMECRAVCNIIRRASDAQLEELAALLDDATDGDEAATRIDRYFHYRLAELSGNRLFSTFIDTYYEMIREIKAVSLRSDERRAAVEREHRAIVEALRLRDEALAQAAVRAHTEAVQRLVDKDE